MIRIADIQNALLPLVGWHQDYDPQQQIDETLTHSDYMGISVGLMFACDTIYMMNGWEKSCGANREYGYALGMDKLIVMEE